VRGPPQRDSASAAAGVGSDFGWLCTDERAHVARVHDDGVDTGALERDHVVARRGPQLGDRELSRRDVRQELEHVVERVDVGIERRAAEQEDLRVDVLEHVAQLLLVARLDDGVEAEAENALVGGGEPVPVVVEPGGHDQVGVGTRGIGGIRIARAPQQRQVGRAADACPGRSDDDAVGALILRGLSRGGVIDLDEHRDPVALGDRLAEPAGTSLVHAREMLTVSPAWTGVAVSGRLQSVTPEKEVAVRIADADRERTVAVLGEHHAVGRLTYDEFVERMDQAYEARTRADLDALTSDLPAQPTAAAPRKRRWVVSIMGGTTRTEDVAGEHGVFDLMGGSDLDLRNARFPDGEARVTAIAIMGGSDIWVPENARVELSGFALMGGNDNRVPPGGDGPLIRVRAWSLMGGIDVRTGKRRSDRRHGLPPPPPPPLNR
jgi:hypothetical protein